MTRDEAREFAKVVQAYADGKDVQFRKVNGSCAWSDSVVSPAFDALNCEYRIKPEPREWWIVPNAAHAASSRDEANELADSMEWPISSIVHVREVMP